MPITCNTFSYVVALPIEAIKNCPTLQLGELQLHDHLVIQALATLCSTYSRKSLRDKTFAKLQYVKYNFNSQNLIRFMSSGVVKILSHQSFIDCL